VVLKALAFRLRGANKGAYDLVCILREYGDGLDDVAGQLSPLLEDQDTGTALNYLGEDFAEVDSIGPMRYAEFVTGARNDDLQADAQGLVRELLRLCRRGRCQRPDRLNSSYGSSDHALAPSKALQRVAAPPPKIRAVDRSLCPVARNSSARGKRRTTPRRIPK
jgi:hypothetical protein